VDDIRVATTKAKSLGGEVMKDLTEVEFSLLAHERNGVFFS
jgi:predicted enzyme related to lactoylglutathione lyase